MAIGLVEKKAVNYAIFWEKVFFYPYSELLFIDGTPKVYDSQLENLASKWVNEYYHEPVPFREPDTMGRNTSSATVEACNSEAQSPNVDRSAR